MTHELTQTLFEIQDSEAIHIQPDKNGYGSFGKRLDKGIYIRDFY
jgi:hypothetical protein